MAESARVTALRADLARLEAAMAAVDPDKLAALVREHRAVLAELAALAPEAKEADPLDEIAARRTARGGATARPRRAGADQG